MTALHLDRIADALHPKTYLVRHDNGECNERNWNILDTDYCEVKK